jgi:tRNA pseudouridine55 synthase
MAFRHSGLILVDKPSGPTSHDVVMAARRGTGEKRVGHTGTLDPLATGLLILCVGAATRLSDFLRGKDKRYVARVRLGQSTDTYDAHGYARAVSRAIPERAAVERALAKFRGRIEQKPPAFSAVKRGGRKAYEYARAGEDIELEARVIEIYSLELVEWKPPEFTLDVFCSSGTYIRSLAHDLGQALKCGAHITGLRRTASGPLDVRQAVTFDALKQAFRVGDWQRYLLPMDLAVSDWPEVNLTDEAAARIQHGQPVPLEEHAEDRARAYNPAGELIALLEADPQNGLWRPHKVLLPPPSNPLDRPRRTDALP